MNKQRPGLALQPGSLLFGPCFDLVVGCFRHVGCGMVETHGRGNCYPTERDDFLEYRNNPGHDRGAQRDRSLTILRPGKNCEAISHADRLAFLIDGEAYFAAARSAILQARESVEILAWDIDSRIELIREPREDVGPAKLGDVVIAALKRNPGLQVRILEWDFSMIYAVEREWVPLFSKPRWPRHPRLHFRFDACHPAGASHHHKVVVIDDRVAFVGGMDLSRWRWDSSRHLRVDDRRVDPAGDTYPPYHDVQIVVEGEIACAMGRMARERWYRATGDRVGGPGTAVGSPWPESVQPDISDVDVAIARTEPGHAGREEIREIETLTIDAIRLAKRSIYIESQFLTAGSVCAVLERRLASEDGPEVVIVLPFKRTSWLEEYSMGLLRSRFLRRLRAADHGRRLRVYYPHVPGLDEQVMNIHSKLLIVDGRFLWVGSANLANRSMGLDTECVVAIEAKDEEDRVAQQIQRMQVRLLAHQLDVPEHEVARSLARTGRLRETIDELRTNAHRCLAPLDGLVDERLEQALPESVLFDPERPLEPDALVEEIVGSERGRSATRRLLIGGGIITALLALAAAWRWSPIAEWIDPTRLAAWLDGVADGKEALALIVLLFAVGSLVGIPLSVLVVAVSLAFDGWRAALYAWLGTMTGAMLTYALGSVLGRELVRKLLGQRINRLSRRLAEHGLLSVVTLRIVPVAPFSIVNLVMGASHIRLRHYVLGTMIGTVPGILAITVFVDRLLEAIVEATPADWMSAAGVGIALAAALWLLHRYLRRRMSGPSER